MATKVKLFAVWYNFVYPFRLLRLYHVSPTFGQEVQMALAHGETDRLISPSDGDRELAETASRALTRAKKDALHVRLEDGSELELPKAVTAMLVSIMTEMAQGNAVTIIPIHAELTTQEAANLLNVSRPYLSKLLDSGKIQHHKVGTHRRVKFADLEAYRIAFGASRDSAQHELARQAQELGMGY
jgi:excisionase family DNA binding protein